MDKDESIPASNVASIAQCIAVAIAMLAPVAAAQQPQLSGQMSSTAVLQSGGNLSAALKDHARHRGWSLDWGVSEDYVLASTMPLPGGSVENDVRAVINHYHRQGGLIGAVVQSDPDKKTIKVSGSSSGYQSADHPMFAIAPAPYRLDAALSPPPSMLATRANMAVAGTGSPLVHGASSLKLGATPSTTELKPLPLNSPIHAFDEGGIAAPAKLSHSAAPLVARSSAAPAITDQPRLSVSPPRPVYTVSEGELLSTALNRWADKSGFRVAWESTQDYEMSADADFQSPNFREAIKKVAKVMNTTHPELAFKTYANNLLLVTEVGR